MILPACFACSIGFSGIRDPENGSASNEKEPTLIVDKADISIIGHTTDTAFTYGFRSFDVTLKNSGTSAANDVRISIWPVFTDTLQIKLFPPEHFTQTIDKRGKYLYLTIPVLGKGESLRILFTDKSLPHLMARTFKKAPIFPRFFLFHASCFQGSSVMDTIYTRWWGLGSPAGDK